MRVMSPLIFPLCIPFHPQHKKKPSWKTIMLKIFSDPKYLQTDAFSHLIAKWITNCWLCLIIVPKRVCWLAYRKNLGRNANYTPMQIHNCFVLHEEGRGKFTTNAFPRNWQTWMAQNPLALHNSWKFISPTYINTNTGAHSQEFRIQRRASFEFSEYVHIELNTQT